MFLASSAPLSEREADVERLVVHKRLYHIDVGLSLILGEACALRGGYLEVGARFGASGIRPRQ